MAFDDPALVDLAKIGILIGSAVGWKVSPGPPSPDKPRSGSVIFYTVGLKDGWLDYLRFSHLEDRLPDLPPAWTVKPDFP